MRQHTTLQEFERREPCRRLLFSSVGVDRQLLEKTEPNEHDTECEWQLVDRRRA